MTQAATNFLHQNAARFGRGEFVAKVYPSGDFTIGRSQPLKRDRKGFDPLAGISQDGFGIANESRQPEIKPDGLELWKIAQEYEKAGNEAMAEHFGHSAGNAIALDPLGLSVATKYRKSATKRGSKGITSLNKRFVKSGAVLLDEMFGSDCVTFGTATLPPLTPENLTKVCENWSKLVRRFFEEMTRLLARRGLSKDFLFVTEIQESRYEKWGVVCPHLHWIAQGRKYKKSHWLILPAEITALWQRQLENLLGESVDCRSSCRIEKPRKCLSKEMGKYLSKGGKLLKKIIQDGNGHLLPSAYIGMSKALKAQIKYAIVQFTGDKALKFIDNLQRFSREGLLCYRPICIEYAGREITVGWVGYVKVLGLEYRLAA